MQFNREYKIRGRLFNIQIDANIEYLRVPEHFDQNWNLYMRSGSNVKYCIVVSAVIYSDRRYQFVEPSERLYEFIAKKFIEDTFYYG